MITLTIIFAFYSMYVAINTSLIPYLDKKTRYNSIRLQNGPKYMFLIFINLGIFTLLFKKKIKRYRKNYYIKKTVKNYSYIIEKRTREISDTEKEFYLSLKRYLQLKKLQRISK
jgi:hypothetical protein